MIDQQLKDEIEDSFSDLAGELLRNSYEDGESFSRDFAEKSMKICVEFIEQEKQKQYDKIVCAICKAQEKYPNAKIKLV